MCKWIQFYHSIPKGEVLSKDFFIFIKTALDKNLATMLDVLSRFEGKRYKKYFI